MPPKKKKPLPSNPEQNLLVEHYEEQSRQRRRRDLLDGLRFYSWLKGHLQVPQAFIDQQAPVYRVSFHPPLTIMGNFATGGRFNVGGAQQTPLMPDLGMTGCIYAASSATCAKLEAGKPHGAGKLYRLTLQRTFRIWDLATVMEGMDYPDLINKIQATPVEGRWKLQKTPLVSQILGHHLRKIGGDGIVYQSQKQAQEQTFAFFISDDAQAQSFFTAESI